MSERKFKIDVGLSIALIALITNIITVSVYIYQAAIMQNQQHASVWPYLEWLPSFNEKGLYIELTNNGTGPAIIKSAKWKVNEIELNDSDSVILLLLGTTELPHYRSTVANRVLAPGHSIQPFYLPDFKWATKLDSAFQKNKVGYSVEYESIFGDRWVCTGTQVEKK